ncbi:hypothetical protein A8O16_03405 [Sphingobium sp. 20006FA]|nr:hypothetical protein A8O16_03405 [Sphingobium sp. 20006FA]
MQDIIVTAQRREERLQDVPISVAAVGSEALASKGIDTLTNISAAVPGLNITVQGSAAQIYVRGVGSSTSDPNNEPSVAVYVDGVYIASPISNMSSFNNISQIEVLKGPQGTLFGRNATGGVIQIRTRDPEHDPAVEVSAGFANYDTLTGNFYGTTGISESAAIDLAVQYRNQFEGYGRNLTLGTETARDSSVGFRSKLLITPSDRTQIRLAGDYSRAYSSRSDYKLPPGALNLDGVVQPGGFDTLQSLPAYTKLKQGGVSLRIEHDLDFARIVSISAFRKSTGPIVIDADGAAGDYIRASLPMTQRSLSQELQLMAPSGSSIDWLVGAFYYNNKAGYKDAEITGLALGGGVAGYDTRQHTKSGSVYGQATVEVLPKLKLTGGLRFTTERQSITGTQTFNGALNPTPFAPKTGFDKLTWRLAANYAVTEDVNAYVSYNRGIKSGGYNLLGADQAGYRPEILDAYEAGIKSELFDKRLRLNLAAFLYDYQDIQFSIVPNTIAVILNAAKARIKGLEFDFEAAPVENLTLTGGATYLHGRYLDFPNAPAFPTSPLSGPQINVDASGGRTVFTPKLTANFGFDYAIPTDAGKFILSSSVYYNDGFNFSLAPYPGNPGPTGVIGAGAGDLLKNDDYTLLSASLQWRAPDDNFGLRFWGANLTNTKYYRTGTPSGFGSLTVRGDPRTYGVTLDAKF